MNEKISLHKLNKNDFPQNWKLLPVGKVLKKTQYGSNESSDAKGNIRIVGMKNIIDGKVKTDNMSYVNLPEKEIQSFKLNKGDLLLNRTNSYDLVGKVGIYDLDLKCVFASYLVRLECKKEIILPDYLNYWLNSYPTQKTLKRIATRAISQANINPTEFKKHCFVTVPPFEEQKKICLQLNNIDQVIDLTERLINLKEVRRAVYLKSLMDMDQRIKGFNDSWNEYKLGELFTERRERNNTDLPLLSITMEKGVIPRHEVERIDISNEDKSKYLRICPGDIGYNTMRMWQGVSGLSTLEGIVSPAYTICTPNNIVDGKFMSYLFKLPRTIHMFYRYSQGLTSDTWNLKYHHFAQIKVSIPDKDEQIEIVKILSLFDQEIKLLNEELELYKIQKQGLKQKLLTGKWRVKVED